jgi:SAM-dependent methyltransferase
MSNRFQEIYERNEWTHGSGEGSLEIQTRGYRAFLQDFLAKKNIRTVVDMGCGDWQFSKLIDWTGIDYHGFDVAPVVISNNVDQFASDKVSFSLYSGNADELPPADLLIVKDVLMHLPNQVVLDFLPNLKKYKYALITNCTNPINPNDVNKDIQPGDFRYIDLRMSPFNLESSLVYSFSKIETGWISKLRTMYHGFPGWKKLTLLVDNSGDPKA